jgi:hypothetical protein
MKYVVYIVEDGKQVRLTRPSEKKKAMNSLWRFRGIGIKAEMGPAKKTKAKVEKEESSEEFLKAKKDFEALND